MIRTAVAIAVLAMSVSGAFAQGDVAAGEQVFKKCMSCHAIGEGAKTKVGPELNQLIGRVAGSVEGYSYSDAMVAAGKGGLVWGPDTLTPFLTKPKDVVAGTKMSFPGLPKPEDVANVIAYLQTFSTPAQ